MDGTTIEDLPTVTSLAELEELIAPDVFVRFSKGPAADQGRHSTDYESGLDLPGLAVNPLHPASWWTRPLKEWLARQLCQYMHLQEESDDERVPWVLSGEIVSRGPDNEPLIGSFRPLAVVATPALQEAKRIYEERFETGQDST